MTARTKAYTLLFVSTLISAIAGPVIKYTLDYLSPFVFLLYRFAIAAVVGAVALSFTKTPHWPSKLDQKFVLLIYGFLATTGSLVLLFLGYQRTTALTVSILDAIYPIMVTIAGVIFLRERVTRRENIGMGIAILGTLAVTGESFLHRSTSPDVLLGNLLIIAALMVGVLLSVMTKILLRHPTNPLALTHLMFIIGFITILPITLYFHSWSEIMQQIINAPWQAHLGVLYMAIMTGTVAYTLWNIGQKSIEIGESSLFAYLYPVLTLPLSIFWLHEPITWPLIIGSAIITVGIIVAETKKKRA